jgi:hypothetical protein
MRREIHTGFCGTNVKRPMGRAGCRWEDHIEMEFKEIGCQDVNWIHLAEDRD